MSVSYARQSLILDPDTARSTTVTVFGCGTVGSNAAVECARLGIGGFELYDDDVVEAHNLPSQRFVVGDLGRSKSSALGDRIREVSNNPRVSVFDTRVVGPVLVGGRVVILAVDSMDSRSTISRVLRNQRGIGLILDFRMSGNVLQCYGFPPGDERYDATLFGDGEAIHTPCGGRTVSYTGALAGCIAANYVRKFLNDQPVPFFTGVDLDAMELMA